MVACAYNPNNAEEKQKITGGFQLASLAYLLSSGPMRDSVTEKEKEKGSS